MTFPTFSFDQVEHDSASADHEIRGRAMQALLVQVQKDPASHERAIGLFRRVLATEQHAWPAISAARGLECIVGPAEARATWLALFEHPNPLLVGNAVLLQTDASYVEPLLDLLRRRKEPDVESAVLRALGRIKHSDVYPVLIEYLANPNRRVNAIEALADQGDARAIPHLEQFLNDETELGHRDERGAVIRVSHIAWTGIRRLRDPSINEAYRTPAYIPFESMPTSLPTMEPPLVLQTAATTGRRRFRVLSCLPLIIAGIQIPWFAAVMFGEFVTTGAISRDKWYSHWIDLSLTFPPVVGVMAAIALLVRMKGITLGERICLILGLLACTFFTCIFGQYFFR